MDFWKKYICHTNEADADVYWINWESQSNTLEKEYSNELEKRTRMMYKIQKVLNNNNIATVL